MRNYKQYLNYKVVPTADGRLEKLPIDPKTLTVCDAHNAALHVTREEAESTGYPLAFVFTEKDPYFFLDIDDCLLPTGEWSQTATGMCSKFAGCYIEISVSGKGLHIFGRQPESIPHGCDNSKLHCQFSTSKRFVALTGTSAIGDANFTPDAGAYRGFINEFFPRTVSASPDTTEWTTTPCPEWDGPDDDNELINRMLRSKSARSIIGNKATVRQLWAADEKALADAFPDISGNQGRSFDWSLADAALCSHLAFWTGKNCERMDALFRQSSLMREKWDSRGDYYSTRTILRAVSLCNSVYRQRPKPSASDDQMRAPGYQYLSPQGQLELFDGCCYVLSHHRVFTPRGFLLKPDQFRAMYGGYIFTVDAFGEKTTRSAWETFTESQAVKFPKADGVCFRPELPPGQIIQQEGYSYVNTYVPVSTDRIAGDPEPFLRLLKAMLPIESDRQILLAYMAACVQHPGAKFQWAPLIQGVQGNGKSFLAACLAHAIGEKYTHIPEAKDIGNSFNSWLGGKLLIIVEEIYTADKADVIETLKWMITNPRVPSQAKGQDQTTGDNRANFFMCSNHKDAIRKTKSDRRFAMFYTAQQEFRDLALSGMGGDYFPSLYTWARTAGFAIVNNYLRTYRIPDELNPAIGCHRAPLTSSTTEAIECSRSAIEQEVIEAVEAGRIGFCDGWISSIAFDKLLEQRRIKLTINMRKKMLADIGYVPHPGLYKGRVNGIIDAEGAKPRLYIREGHPCLNVTDSGKVSRMYQEAQGYLVNRVEQTTAASVI